MFEVKLDVIERVGGVLVKTGDKIFRPAEKLLSKWIERPRAQEFRPPMSSAIMPATKSVFCDTVACGALGYMVSPGNDVQHSGQGVSFLSGPFSNGHGWSIIPINCHKSLVAFAIRKLVNPTWLNWQDQFDQPDETHPDYDQFTRDAVVFAIFHGKNQSSSLANIKYKDKVYDIPNEFFWMTREEMLGIKGLPLALYNKVKAAKEDRFAAKWLQGKKFSEDAQKVLEAGKQMVVTSIARREDAEDKFQLGRWDAGWYQVRMGLYGKGVKFKKTEEMEAAAEAFSVAYKSLGDRLRPMIYELGCLPEERMVK